MTKEKKAKGKKKEKKRKKKEKKIMKKKKWKNIYTLLKRLQSWLLKRLKNLASQKEEKKYAWMCTTNLVANSASLWYTIWKNDFTTPDLCNPTQQVIVCVICNPLAFRICNDHLVRLQNFSFHIIHKHIFYEKQSQNAPVFVPTYQRLACPGNDSFEFQLPTRPNPIFCLPQLVDTLTIWPSSKQAAFDETGIYTVFQGEVMIG